MSESERKEEGGNSFKPDSKKEITISHEVKRIGMAALGSGLITSAVVYFTAPANIELYSMIWGMVVGIIAGAMMREEVIT